MTETKLADISKQHLEFIMKSKDPGLTTTDIKTARAKADVTKREIRKLEQKIKYWKLKLLSREELVRNAYLEAFNKGQEWNNKEEIEKFKKAQIWGQQRQPANKPIENLKEEKESTTISPSDE